MPQTQEARSTISCMPLPFPTQVQLPFLTTQDADSLHQVHWGSYLHLLAPNALILGCEVVQNCFSICVQVHFQPKVVVLNYLASTLRSDFKITNFNGKILMCKMTLPINTVAVSFHPAW